MDINELEAFKLSDAVKFHDKLNPNLWTGTQLDPKVKKQLMLIAEDFITTLGISDLDVRDITISGSNAAYSYTAHSDLDLHILVDMDKLQNNEIYRELFTAKKTLYNDQHDITIRNVPVEVYVQDTNEPVQSLGEYSVLNDKWIKIPKKQRANFNQAATKAKYESLAKLIELAIKTADIDRVKKMIDMVKRYRKAGLAKGGEFSPENLAYKAVRSHGGIDALYDLRDKLHSDELSIEEASSREDAIIKINKIKNMSGRNEHEIKNINAIIDKLMKQFNIRPEEIGMAQRTLVPNYPKSEPVAPVYPKREPVDPLKAKMAAAQYEKMMAMAAMKDEWEKFLKRKGFIAESYTTKQQVIDHFVRMARKRGEDVNLAMRKGAGAWERGWRGPKPKEPEKPKEIKPYDPERYKNVRLPYIDEAESDVSKASVVQFKTLPGPGEPRHSFRVVYDGKVIAYGEVEKDSVHDDEHGAAVQEIVVHSRYRRMGIASKIYSAIERKFGYELHPSDDVKPNGQEFWRARGNLDEASGYIPSAKEKNDPRFKTALTVDVKPDAIKKNAKAFGFKTSRAGIPPQARADGKIAESLINEGMTFNPVVEKEFSTGEKYWTGSDWERKITIDCRDCDGTGKDRTQLCVYCGGTGKEEDRVSDAPELQVSNANGEEIQRMLGLDPDYSGIIHNKDLPDIMRRLIILKNKGSQQYTKDASVDRGTMRRQSDDQGVARIGRGPTMYDAGRSQSQVDRYIDRLIEIIQFAQKNNTSIGWG